MPTAFHSTVGANDVVAMDFNPSQKIAQSTTQQQRRTMKSLEMIQKLSVLHCIYQMIASADGKIEEERDHEAIELALSELSIASYSWSSALQLNPHDCFIHINMLSDADKQMFRELLLRIAGMGGNLEFRTSCANHLFQLCGA